MDGKIIKLDIDVRAESRFPSEARLRGVIDDLDRSDMLDRLRRFPEQFGGEGPLRVTAAPPVPAGITGLAFCGLGGSAIAGDLIGEIFGRQLRVPSVVVRDYELPAWVDRRTLVILMSYSGNTEETLALFRSALEKNVPLAAITNSGQLAAAAGAAGVPLVPLPSGYPPRTALGFLFTGALAVLEQAGLLAPPPGLTAKIAAAAGDAVLQCRPETPFADNPARRLAAALRGTVPVIYSAGCLAATAVRWKNQLEENANHLAFTGVFPEMNHNEIVGWANPARTLRDFSLVFLRDALENERLCKRFAVTAGLLQPRRCFVQVAARAESHAQRVAGLVALGDWASYYLALENGVDPTPVERITFLKEKLAG